MLESLEQIDWVGVGLHVYGNNEKIPSAIRDLISDDPDVRGQAREFLLGSGQDFGDVYDTTRHIIPFVIELIGDPSTPGRDELLNHVAGTARHIVYDDLRVSIRMLKLHLATYDAIVAGTQVYISLLKSNEKPIRLAAICLLKYLTDEVEVTIPELTRCFESEKDEEVQIEILMGLKNLLSSLDWTRRDLKAQYVPFFQQIISSEKSHIVRVAGARAYAETIENRLFDKQGETNNSLEQKAAETLKDEFLQTSTAVDFRGWSNELYEATLLIKDIAKFKSNHLLEVFGNPDITPTQAHLVARGLLAIVMQHVDDSYWNCRRNYDDNIEVLRYVHNYPIMHNLQIFLRSEGHFDPVLKILRTIISSQKYWEIPTNMFSFFVGLPDSRAELSVLLNSNL